MWLSVHVSICRDLRSQLLQLTHVHMAFLYDIYFFLHFDSHTCRYNNNYYEMWNNIIRSDVRNGICLICINLLAIIIIRESKHFLINVLCHIKIKGELNEFDLFILHFFHECFSCMAKLHLKKTRYNSCSCREPMPWAAGVLSVIKWYQTLTQLIYITFIIFRAVYKTHLPQWNWCLIFSDFRYIDNHCLMFMFTTILLFFIWFVFFG